MLKKKLEILLEKVESFEKPIARLEQYVTPANIAAEVLYYAYLKGDIEGKIVFDLGCGTGKFAIGAALLGAREVRGFDVDEEALKVAKKNAEKLARQIAWVKSDVKDIKGSCDTVIQNPPFGVKKEKADRVFLKKALELGRVIYSMHKAETREFVTRYAEKLGGIITDVKRVEFLLPHSYKFHKKEKKKISVDVYRIVKGQDTQPFCLRKSAGGKGCEHSFRRNEISIERWRVYHLPNGMA
jgi:putative methylase